MRSPIIAALALALALSIAHDAKAQGACDFLQETSVRTFDLRKFSDSTQRKIGNYIDSDLTQKQAYLATLSHIEAGNRTRVRPEIPTSIDNSPTKILPASTSIPGWIQERKNVARRDSGQTNDGILVFEDREKTADPSSGSRASESRVISVHSWVPSVERFEIQLKEERLIVPLKSGETLCPP